MCQIVHEDQAVVLQDADHGQQFNLGRGYKSTAICERGVKIR